MRPLPSVLIMLALVLTAVGVALFVAGPPPSSAPPSSAARVAEPSATAGAPPPAAAPASPARKRGGRVLPLAEAIKELDLLKPARQKLADDLTVSTPRGESFPLGRQRRQGGVGKFLGPGWP